jgi:hypothetical protein
MASPGEFKTRRHSTRTETEFCEYKQLIDLKLKKKNFNFILTLIRCNAVYAGGPIRITEQPIRYPCKDYTTYYSQQWCGHIRNTGGPWAQCLSGMSSNVIEFNFKACVLDLCVFETSKQLEKKRCDTLNQFNIACKQLADQLNQTWSYDWRNKLNCRKLRLFSSSS